MALTRDPPAVRARPCPHVHLQLIRAELDACQIYVYLRGGLSFAGVVTSVPGGLIVLLTDATGGTTMFSALDVVAIHTPMAKYAPVEGAS